MTSMALKKSRRDNRTYYYLREVSYTKKETKFERGELRFSGGYRENHRGEATLKDIAEHGTIDDIWQVTFYYFSIELKETPLFDRGENIYFASVLSHLILPYNPERYRAEGVDPTAPFDERIRELFRKVIADHGLENKKAIGINFKTYDLSTDRTIKMGKKGRITLPNWICSLLNLELGDEMWPEVGRERGEIVIKLRLQKNKTLSDYEVDMKD